MVWSYAYGSDAPTNEDSTDAARAVCNQSSDPGSVLGRETRKWLLSWLDFFASTSIEKRKQQASIRRAVMSDKIRLHHLERKAILYVRQSSAYQVTHNL